MKTVIKFGVVIGVAGALLMAKDYCYSYSTLSFNAYAEDSNRVDKTITPIESVIVKLPKPITQIKKDVDPISVIVKVAGKEYVNSWIMSYRNDDDIHQFGGECDSGQLIIDKYMNMRFWFVSFEKDDENLTEPEIALDLYAKDKSRWLTGVKVNCPSNRHNKKAKHNLYVCYQKKINDNGTIKYIGCKIVDESCKSIGLEHFGHYLNNKEAQDALQRCIESKPKIK